MAAERRKVQKTKQLAVDSKMAPFQNGDSVSSARRSHSLPQRSLHREQQIKRAQSYEVSSSGDSTRSLLSPLYHSSFEDDDDDDDEKLDPLRAASTFKENASTGHQRKSSERSKQRGDRPTSDSRLTPWEEWLVSKERRGRIEMQTKALEDMKQHQELERIKHNQELHKMAAEEQHKEWVRKKNEQEKKEKELKMLKEQKEREAKERQKAEMEEKAKEKFNEWLRRKQLEEKEKKRKEKEEEEKRFAKIREKKEKAQMTFEEWLENAKSKPRPVLNSYGYANGKLTGYYDGSAAPAPGFCNPIPWKPINVPPPPKEVVRKNTAKTTKKQIPLSYRPSVMAHRPKDNLCIVGMRKK